VTNVTTVEYRKIVVNGTDTPTGATVEYRNIVVMLEKLPYSKLVEKSVLEMIQGGVPIRQITHGAVVAL